MAARKGRGGPKPKPTAMQELSGAFEKNPQRRNHREPVAPQDRPVLPDYFAEEEIREWNRLVAKLERNGVLSSVDAAAIEQFAVNAVQFHVAWRDVNKTGSWFEYVDGNGNRLRKRNPAHTALLAYGRRLTELLREFGLTPVSYHAVHRKLICQNDQHQDLSDKYLT